MHWFLFILLNITTLPSFANEIPLSEIQSVNLVIFDAKREMNDATKSKFVLQVYLNGASRDHLVGSYTVSPGALVDKPKPGKEPELTPEGRFTPHRLSVDHVSGQFGGKALGIFETGKMPYSIFFHQGFAIHGSAATVDGKPASKGCVRLRKRHARKVFRWTEAAIRNTGRYNSVQVYIHDTESDYVASYRRKHDDRLRQSEKK